MITLIVSVIYEIRPMKWGIRPEKRVSECLVPKRLFLSIDKIELFMRNKLRPNGGWLRDCES